MSAVLVLIAASALSFVILHVLPGSAALQLLGLDATSQQILALETSMGLDQPAILRYWQWLTDLLAGDMGVSLINGQPVAGLIAERLPVTIELALLVVLAVAGFSVPCAFLCAMWPGRIIDTVIRTACMVGLSTASYVIAMVLVVIVSLFGIGAFPTFGYSPLSAGVWENLQRFFLPTVALAIPFWSLYTILLRSQLINQLQTQGYAVAASGRGLSRSTIIIRHALRNSCTGFVTILGVHFGALLGGAVVIEQIFGLPGLGQLLVQSIGLRDIPLLQGIILWVTGITVAVNLAVDFGYHLIDPRIRVDW